MCPKKYPVGATALDNRLLVEAFERKGLSMQHNRQFIEIFRSACEGTESAARLETAMRRADVKNKYDAAMLTETAATATSKWMTL